MSYYPYEEWESVPAELLAHARDHFIGLLEAVYKTGNVEDVERHIDEMTLLFDMKTPQCAPKIKSKSNDTDRMLQAWVGYTRAYAEMMCNPKGGK